MAICHHIYGWNTVNFDIKQQLNKQLTFNKLKREDLANLHEDSGVHAGSPLPVAGYNARVNDAIYVTHLLRIPQTEHHIIAWQLRVFAVYNYKGHSQRYRLFVYGKFDFIKIIGKYHTILFISVHQIVKNWIFWTQPQYGEELFSSSLPQVYRKHISPIYPPSQFFSPLHPSTPSSPLSLPLTSPSFYSACPLIIPDPKKSWE